MLAADEPPLLDEQPSCNCPGRVARAAGSARLAEAARSGDLRLKRYKYYNLR